MGEQKGPVMLLILDGYGLGDVNDPMNAVVQAHPKYMQSLWDKYPHTSLKASGEAVGLPAHQMGNSEVGHLNLGAGRVVYQDLSRITKDMEDGSFFQRPVIQELYKHAKGHALHLIGLASDGNVHCSIDHLKHVIKGAKDHGVEKVYVHALLDGRDVAPKSALKYLLELESYMSSIGCGRLATLGGRHYAMDRDSRWERVEQEYRACVCGIGADMGDAATAEDIINLAYSQGLTDEFLPPVVLDPNGCIQDGDAVLYANFRPDRGRELTKALVLDDFDGFTRYAEKKDIYMATMTTYEDGLPVHVVYGKETLVNTLGQVVADQGLKQLRIAETEKYAHVTFFFNGRIEAPFKGEDRLLVASPKVATYDMQPEMSAGEVTTKVVEAIQSGTYDLIIMNLANPDMVGHTGNFEATKQAIQAVDGCVKRIVEAMDQAQGDLIITADHGNAEVMLNHKTQAPHTAHTSNLVPLILVSKTYQEVTLQEGALCDVAPTLLRLLGLRQPEEMTGRSLF